jgi:hypothetical protein
VTLKPEKLGGKIFEGWKFMKSLSPPSPICGMWVQSTQGVRKSDRPPINLPQIHRSAGG